MPRSVAPTDGMAVAPSSSGYWDGSVGRVYRERGPGGPSRAPRGPCSGRGSARTDPSRDRTSPGTPGHWGPREARRTVRPWGGHGTAKGSPAPLAPRGAAGGSDGPRGGSGDRGLGFARRPASPVAAPRGRARGAWGGSSRREPPVEDPARGTHVGRDAMDWGARPCLSPSGFMPHVARRTLGLAIPCLMHARDPGVTPYLARSPPPSRTHRPRRGVGRTDGPAPRRRRPAGRRSSGGRGRRPGPWRHQAARPPSGRRGEARPGLSLRLRRGCLPSLAWLHLHCCVIVSRAPP
jgi:hypothetical protein